MYKSLPSKHCSLSTLVDPVTCVDTHLLLKVEASSNCTGHLNQPVNVGALEEATRIPRGIQSATSVLLLSALQGLTVHRSAGVRGLWSSHALSTRLETPSVEEFIPIVAEAAILHDVPVSILSTLVDARLELACAIVQFGALWTHTLVTNHLSFVALDGQAGIHAFGHFFALVLVVIGSGRGCVVGEWLPMLLRNTSLVGGGEQGSTGTGLIDGVAPTRTLPIRRGNILNGPFKPHLVTGATAGHQSRGSAAQDDGE